MYTPAHLREFAEGYLYTSGMITSAKDIQDFYCETRKGRLNVTTTLEIDFELLGKRMYTSGYGKGVFIFECYCPFFAAFPLITFHRYKRIIC